MFDNIDLPLLWAGIISLGVLIYVLLDGFDLGIGILFGLAKSELEQNQMTATIEPVWDGNETWLIIGGAGLFAAFPKAYAIIMPAFYLPILIMLAALIFRGVAFEFRHKAATKPIRMFWNGAFVAGSLMAAISQGLMLGGLVQGIEVVDGVFAGGAFDWLSPFSLLVAAAVPIGYVLLGSCWLILKTEGALHERARVWARTALIFVSIAFAAVSLSMLSVDPNVTDRWGFSMTSVNFSQLMPLLPIPLAGAALCLFLFRDLSKSADEGRRPDWRPYLEAVGIFVTGYLGLIVSIYPNIVPFEVTLWEAAARDNALLLTGVGAVIMIPTILCYTAYVYWLFRGKVKEGDGYHAH